AVYRPSWAHPGGVAAEVFCPQRSALPDQGRQDRGGGGGACGGRIARGAWSSISCGSAWRDGTERPGTAELASGVDPPVLLAVRAEKQWPSVACALQFRRDDP